MALPDLSRFYIDEQSLGLAGRGSAVPAGRPRHRATFGTLALATPRLSTGPYERHGRRFPAFS